MWVRLPANGESMVQERYTLNKANEAAIESIVCGEGDTEKTQAVPAANTLKERRRNKKYFEDIHV